SQWELREFKLNAGVLVPQPCKNSPDPTLLSDNGFLTWVRDNQIAINLGQIAVPTTFLAPSSITNGQRLTLPPDLHGAEQKLNKTTCNGCHSTETGTKSTHLAERRFSNARAVASTL